jgi:hypothetical protein
VSGLAELGALVVVDYKTGGAGPFKTISAADTTARHARQRAAMRDND